MIHKHNFASYYGLEWWMTSDGLCWQDLNKAEEHEKGIIKMMFFEDLVKRCHKSSYEAGWWTAKDGTDIRTNPYTFSNKLMLIVSELSEAMEADRRGLMDSHLPTRKGTEVELADAIIRICDLACAYNLDLAGAVHDKMLYNQLREDHKPENRQKENGKKYW